MPACQPTSSLPRAPGTVVFCLFMATLKRRIFFAFLFFAPVRFRAAWLVHANEGLSVVGVVVFTLKPPSLSIQYLLYQLIQGTPHA